MIVVCPEWGPRPDTRRFLSGPPAGTGAALDPGALIQHRSSCGDRADVNRIAAPAMIRLAVSITTSAASKWETRTERAGFAMSMEVIACQRARAFGQQWVRSLLSQESRLDVL